MQTSLGGIAHKARINRKHRFQNLFGMLNEEYLKQTYGRLNKSSAPGVDKVTVREYGKGLGERIKSLVEQLKRGSYRARLIRRKNIPKGNGKVRPLGIPATEDKLLQTAASDILMAIYEQDFLPNSYGYRPKVGAAEAVRRLSEELCFGGYNFVVDADIKGYFNNIDHDWMLRMLEVRVDDKSFLRLIRKWLKAGVLEEDKTVIKPELGTPQGGSISPILANIYLHYVFDLWFDKIVRKYMRGKIFFARYADDFVCLFQCKEDAEKFYRALPRRLGKFGLELSMEKTKIIVFNSTHMENSFDFLGFEFRWRKSRKGKPCISPRTALKKLKTASKDFYKWCKEHRDLGTKKIFETVNAKLQGHYNYFGFPGNYDRMYKYYYRALMSLKKWLSRRSQRGYCSWGKYNRMQEIYAIVKPRIKRSVPVTTHVQLDLFFS